MSGFNGKTSSQLWLIVLAVIVSAINSPAIAQYKQINLVTTNPTSAPHHDLNLVNAWGLSFLPGSPFWVSDEVTGKTTVYNASGALQLTVKVPPATGTGTGTGTPTGQVANPNGKIFMVHQGTTTGSAVFIFATMDGTISGWNPNVNAGSAVIAVNRHASGDSYTGLTILTVTTATGPQTFLYAADAAHNLVRVFSSSFKLVRSFRDANTPPGLSVYGIQTIRGKVYITLGTFPSTAGAVDVFTPATNSLKRLITNPAGGHLNLPWGLAMAPSNFGEFSNDLLVGNTGNGWINAFNPTTGAFLGTLKNTVGKVITIDGLWALKFGGGSTANNGATNQLFFTGGPNGYTKGVFGVIEFE